jgi:hypothetical protein
MYQVIGALDQEMAPWCSWLSRQSNTLKVPRSSLGGVITFCGGDNNKFAEKLRLSL